MNPPRVQAVLVGGPSGGSRVVVPWPPPWEVHTPGRRGSEDWRPVPQDAPPTLPPVAVYRLTWYGHTLGRLGNSAAATYRYAGERP